MFKEMLLSMVEDHLDEQSCGLVIARLESSLLGGSLVGAFKDWQENEHPRDDSGRFSPSGRSRPLMKKSEANKWDKIGHSSPKSKELTKKKGELRKAIRERDSSLSKEIREVRTAKVVKIQREISNLERETKKERRLNLEGDVAQRILKKQLKEFHDIDDEIDYMEEKYADRNVNSPTLDQVVFPPTKSGQKAKQKYEALQKRRAELDEEIEWDKVKEDVDDSSENFPEVD